MTGITIKDVAADAGVSTATVSHVINNTRNVSEEVASRVRDSINRLNYYPNKLVGSLRGKSTFTIGMVIPSIANETFGKMAEYIQTQLFELGYNLTVCNTSYDSELEERALNTFLMKKMDAVIAIPANHSSAKLEEISKSRVPVILVDRVLVGVDTDTIEVDNHKGEYEMTSYLIRMGHRHIGYVDRMVEQSHSVAQREGYLAALADNGIAFQNDYIVKATGHFYKAGMDAAQTLMQRCPEITAIACYYDLIAFGVMRGLIGLGYNVPKDVSVVGYDNMTFTEATWPCMTTVETPTKLIAMETCKLLQKRLDEKTSGEETWQPRKHIILQPKLVIRESVIRINSNAE